MEKDNEIELVSPKDYINKVGLFIDGFVIVSCVGGCLLTWGIVNKSWIYFVGCLLLLVVGGLVPILLRHLLVTLRKTHAVIALLVDVLEAEGEPKDAQSKTDEVQV